MNAKNTDYSEYYLPSDGNNDNDNDNDRFGKDKEKYYQNNNG